MDNNFNNVVRVLKLGFSGVCGYLFSIYNLWGYSGKLYADRVTGTTDDYDISHKVKFGEGMWNAFLQTGHNILNSENTVSFVPAVNAQPVATALLGALISYGVISGVEKLCEVAFRRGNPNE